MFIEIIASNIEDIKIINNSKANRIEFCYKLEEGGLTPDIKSIKWATKVAKKPLMIMLRKHSDNFNITSIQLNNLVRIIDQIDHLKFKGYVFGAIKKNQIDFKALKLILKHLAKINSTKIITFHKAFDFVGNKVKAIKKLTKFSRVKTVLTAGGPGNIENNLLTLKKIQNSKIKILLGGGVTLYNLKLFQAEGFKNIHMGTAVRKNNSWHDPIEIKLIPK